MSSLASNVGSTAQNMMSRFSSAVQNGGSRAVSTARNVASNIVSGMRNGLSNLYGVAVNAMEGFVNGIISMGQRALNAAENIAHSIVSTIQSALDIHSPSRVMRDKVGRWIPAGLAEGIEAYGDTATDAAKKVANNVTAAMTDATQASYMNGSYEAQVDHAVKASMKATPIELGLNVNMPNAAFKGLVRSITSQQNVDMELGLS